MGVLTKNDILKLIESHKPPLIENHDLSCIKSATYDLRLGGEYIKEGKYGRLSESDDPYLEIPAHDVVIASSYENVNFPLNVVGRFGLRLSLVMKGLVLANEPQIDPGSRGKLFCILYNLSEDSIIIPIKSPFATLEFQTTESEAPPYDGKYLDKINIHEVVKEILPKSGLKKLWDEHNELKQYIDNRIQRFYTAFFIIITLLITLIGVFLGIALRII